MLKASRSEKEAGDLLGTYLLQGWIMTDEICKMVSCSFPLMRSKDGSLSFCTYHDQLPNNGATFNYKKSAPSPAAADTKEKQQDPVVSDVTSVAAVDNGEEELRIRRERREQSSKASQLIGQKMLQRWALLNDHCPNSACYAVPLIRNPDTKQMFCVICENIILTEDEALELEKKTKSKQEKEVKANNAEIPSQSKPSEPTQPKPIHSPIIPQITEERKRQKIEPAPVSQRSCSDFFSSEHVVSTLTIKMNELTERVKESHDPVELSKLFKSIKQCAGAIQACIEAGEVYDKSVSIYPN